MQKKEPTSHRAQGVSSSKKQDPQSTHSPPLLQTPKTPEPSAPQTDDMWHAQWKARWKTAREVDTDRQKELEKCRTLPSDKETGVYPFSGMHLNRADVEWLLATYHFPDGSEFEQSVRIMLSGADLRGTNLREINLYGSRLEGTNLCGARLKGVNLSEAHLEGANLSEAHLEGTNLSDAQLKGANLRKAWLKEADLGDAQLEKTFLSGAQLEQANFRGSNLEKAYLKGAQLKGANLSKAQLRGANLHGVQLKGAKLIWAHLEEANLQEAQLEGANLRGAQLEKSNLQKAQLKGANLHGAQLVRANLSGAQLEGADLRDVLLGDIHRIGPHMVDIQWSTANLAVIDWSQVVYLGDEDEARQKLDGENKRKGKDIRLAEYKTAVRANRQLSVVLQGQGLDEDAGRFAYRAQVLQKEVYWFQMIQDGLSLRQRLRALGSWLFSWFLFLLAGYGYKPLRSFLAYVLVIAGFATVFYLFGLNDLIGPHHLPGPHYLSWYEAVVVSMTAFHGRGFFVGTFSPGDPQALVAAIEAFFGLLIEVTFIATLTQRLFSR